jgi:hypothetical protein
MSDPRLRVTQRGAVDEQELIAALDDPTIRVVLPDGTPHTEHQILALALVDLLGRVFPRIEIVCDPDAPAATQLPPAVGQSLRGRLEQARSHGAIDPMDIREATLTIAIGRDTNADLYVDGGGWQSYVGREASKLAHPAGSTIPVGPLAAACRGAGQVFALLLLDLFGPAQAPERGYSSALTFATGDEPVQEPQLSPIGPLDAVLVGGGSVGGAAVYTFARVDGLAGELVVVDPQRLEGHNFDRALLATREVVKRKAAKATVAADALAHLAPALDVRGERGTIADHVAAGQREHTLPLVLCAVDSPEARRSVQDCLPLELINAACRPGEVQISGHVTDEGPCVCCLHMPDVMDSDQIRARLIAEATGLAFMTVVGLLIADPPALLDELTIKSIEIKTGRDPGALGGYVGRRLDELWHEQLLYGGATVSAGGTTAVVAAPWVTALAGVLLASEALKAAGGPAYADLRLGPNPGSPGVRYAEDPYVGAPFAQLTRPERYGSECLCRSPRRLRLLHQRYDGGLKGHGPPPMN